MSGALAFTFWQRLAENTFYHQALLGGLAIALLCSVLSVWVVLKRMAFIGEGIAHGAFGGVGVALLAGLAFASMRSELARDAVICAFCVSGAIIIGALTRRGKLHEDTAIGIVLVAAMALGLLLIDLRAVWLQRLIEAGSVQREQIGYTPSFHDILFGNILFITRQQVIAAWILAGVIVLAVVAFFKELVFFTFDEETASVFGVRTNLLYYGLLICLGLAVVAAMRSLGVVMASALLILPGASARCWSNRIGWVTVLSAILGTTGLMAGLLLSIYLRHFSPGGVIVMTLCAIFLVSFLARHARRGRKREAS